MRAPSPGFVDPGSRRRSYAISQLAEARLIVGLRTTQERMAGEFATVLARVFARLHELGEAPAGPPDSARRGHGGRVG